jgi:hypothetical protein
MFPKGSSKRKHEYYKSGHHHHAADLPFNIKQATDA